MCSVKIRQLHGNYRSLDIHVHLLAYPAYLLIWYGKIGQPCLTWQPPFGEYNQ